MTVYNINLGIGWASSGVEYAQAYRANIFRKIKQDAKFIFMDMIQSENIAHLTRNIGFEDNQVIWLYQYFTDIKIAPTTYTVEELLENFNHGRPTREENNGKSIRYFYESQDLFITVYLTKEGANTVDRVEYVSRGNLIRKDYFSYTKVFTEYYTPRNNTAYLYQRRFFNEDGSTAYDELIDGDNRSIFRFEDKILYSKEHFIEYFMQSLNLTKKDLVILDRETGIGQAVVQNVKPAKLGVVVHAEHYSENSTNENTILWNNYYEYQFTNHSLIDVFFVATKAQNDTLARQFAKYNNAKPRIETIPVGSLDELKYPTKNGRKPYSLITASRLASEKHIDWLVRGVALAKEQLPELTFDIYGKGGEETKIQNEISRNNAGEYIKLKGHANLTEIYKNYEVYIAASTSEGFGLTLLEAIGSGLPIIGFDVPYGNQTFVTEGKNGYLIPKEEEDNIDQIAQEFAKNLVKLFSGDIKEMHKHSYENAKEYLTSAVEKKWQEVIKEVTND